jgi:Transcriptional regulator
MGLRETKKLQTRQAIADSAMGLFVERGFDHVTVGDVARHAGVSEKTVFNYFPTKEDIFFDEVPERLEALGETAAAAAGPVARRGDARPSRRAGESAREPGVRAFRARDRGVAGAAGEGGRGHGGVLRPPCRNDP